MTINLQAVRKQITREADTYVEAVRAFLAASARTQGLSAADLAAITGLAPVTVKGALTKGAHPNSRTMAMIGAAIGIDLKRAKDGLAARSRKGPR